MWSELYINDPDILSDVTEIAVKKLGYWIERRLREGRSSPPPRTFYLYRVLLNMWDTFRESTFHVGSKNGRNCCSPPCLRSHVDEPISIRRMKNKSRSEFDQYEKKRQNFSRPSSQTSSSSTIPQCFRIVFHARFFTFLVSPVQPRLLFPRITR